MFAPTRRRVGRDLAAVLLVLVGLLLGTAPPVSATTDTTVGGIDIEAVVAQLGDDHVALVGDVGQPLAEWTGVVADARADHLALSLVVLGTAPEGATPTDVAEAVLGQVRGTVLVLAPATTDGSTVGLASSDVGQAQVEAVHSEFDGRAPTPGTAAMVVDQLTDHGFPWFLVAGAVLILLIAVGVGFGLWRRHRHRQAPEVHPELTEWLRARLTGAAVEIADLRAAADSTDRDDLRTRVATITADHEALLAAIAPGPVDRSAVDRLTGRLATLDAEIAALRVEVDSARAG